MQEYRDNVMLRQVFSLKDHQNNILETPLSQKFLAAKNPLHFGERYRNINVIKKDKLYYIIVDDTTEVKAHQGIETKWTASLSIHSFDPRENKYEQLWTEELAESNKMIFFNSIISGNYIYFMTK